ncbi:MAG: EamA family transporter [Clostridia bacterium]|nr:EamA family transporter [Clostridia bacterium]
MQMQNSKTQQAYLKLFLGLLLFGLNGSVASFIALDSYEIVFLRTLIGSVFLIIMFLFSKKEPKGRVNKRDRLYIMISGMAMGVSWLFLYEAYRQIGVGIATLIYYCGPMIVIAISPYIFGERITKMTLVGFLMVILGMLALNGDAFHQGGISMGIFYCLFSATLYAIMVVFNKKAKAITGLENAMLQLFASFLTVATFLFFKQGLSVFVLGDNLMPVLFLGIVNTGVSGYLYFSSMHQFSAGTIAICSYIEPVSSLVFAGVLLGEKLLAVQFFGALLILGGALVGEWSMSGRKLA